MTKENKIYFIEVYDEENEFLGQEEYPSLLAAYDAAKDIPEMYSGFNFDHLEIVDSEDLNRVYYTFSTFNGGKIHEWELRELINNRNNAAEVEIENATAAEVSLTDKIKAKISGQKKPRKSVIDWNATFEQMRLDEIFALQKDLKKFLKLGQIELAENVFNNIKLMFKAA